MKLSEAIRLGAMMGPQAFGKFMDGDSMCALYGAALAGGLDLTKEGFIHFMPKHFPIFVKTAPKLPCECGAVYGSDNDTGDVVHHLNDYHHWTRERIARWVESVENAIEMDTVVEEVGVLA